MPTKPLSFDRNEPKIELPSIVSIVSDPSPPERSAISQAIHSFETLLELILEDPRGFSASAVISISQ